MRMTKFYLIAVACALLVIVTGLGILTAEKPHSTAKPYALHYPFSKNPPKIEANTPEPKNQMPVVEANPDVDFNIMRLAVGPEIDYKIINIDPLPPNSQFQDFRNFEFPLEKNTNETAPKLPGALPPLQQK